MSSKNVSRYLPNPPPSAGHSTIPEIPPHQHSQHHPLFYLSLLNHPFLQTPGKQQLATAAYPHTLCLGPRSITTSNFSINKILECDSRPPDQPSHTSSGSRSSTHMVLQPQLVAPPEPRALVDTARMFWLQHMTRGLSAQPPQSGLTAHHPGAVTKKRKLGRNPRIPFTQQQIDQLERKYGSSRYLSSLDVVALSQKLDLSESRVKIWFQNRRARERRDKKSPTSQRGAERSRPSDLLSPVTVTSSQPPAADGASSRAWLYPTESHISSMGSSGNRNTGGGKHGDEVGFTVEKGYRSGDTICGDDSHVAIVTTSVNEVSPCSSDIIDV